MTASTRAPWTLAGAIYAGVHIGLIVLFFRLDTPWAMVLRNVSDLPLTIGVTIAFVCAARRRGGDPGVVHVLGLLSVGLALLAAGSCAWTYVALVHHREAGQSWPQAGYLLFYPATFLGLLRFPRARRVHLDSWTLALDGATLVVGSVVLTWYFVLRPGAAHFQTPLQVVQALLFPIGDLLMLFGLTTVVVRQSAGRGSAAFRLLLAGYTAILAADLLYAFVYSEANGQAPLPEMIAAVGFALLIAAAERYARARPDGPEWTMPAPGSTAPGDWFATSLPYAGAAAVYLLTLSIAIHRWPSALSGLVIAAGPVTLLLVARGLIAVRQNAGLLTERAERLGQTRLVGLLDATTDFVAVSNARGTTTYMNRAGRRMIGIADEDDVSRLSLADIYTSEAQQYAAAVAVPAALRDGVWAGESTVRRRDGAEIPVSQVIVAHRPLRGEPSVSTIMRDISEWKKLERMKSDFVSTVSHELRTPLTAIRGSLGLLEGGTAGALPPRALHLMQLARSNCDRLVRLISDMLDLDKIEAGKLELRPEVLLPADVVRAAVDGLRGMADQRGLRFVVGVAPTSAVVGDRDRLIQVLTNLLSNALKFSPTGAAITVVVEPNQSMVRFAVENPGPGIPAHDRPRLFSRFQQLDSSDGRQYGGTGLGLAIAKAIVEQHGGTIGVASEPNVSTTFWFEVPERPEAAAVGATAHTERAGRPASGDRAPGGAPDWPR